MDSNLLSWQYPGLFGDILVICLGNNSIGYSPVMVVVLLFQDRRCTFGSQQGMEAVPNTSWVNKNQRLDSQRPKVNLTLVVCLSVSLIIWRLFRITFIYLRKFPLYYISISPLKCNSVIATFPSILSFNHIILLFPTYFPVFLLPPIFHL